MSGALRWRVFTHGFGLNLPAPDGRLVMPSGVEVGWMEGTGSMGFGQMAGKHPGLIKSAQMKRAYPFTVGCRAQVQAMAQNWVWRDAPASSVRGGLQGLSQVGLDYWDLQFTGPKPPNLGPNNLIQLGAGGFNPRHELAKSLTKPGPHGAEPTLRYELLREGLQAAAALVAARDTAAGRAFDAFIQGRLENAHGVVLQGQLIDRAPDTRAYQFYSPGDLTNCLTGWRKSRPGTRLVVVARSHERDAESCRKMGAAAGNADAVVVAKDDATTESVRDGVPSTVPSEVAPDREQATRKARELAGANGIVVAVVDRSFSGVSCPVMVEQRGQDQWNAAAESLYGAAGAAR